MEDLYRQKEAGARKLYWRKKADWLWQSHSPLGELSHRYNGLAIPDWYKMPFLGEPKLIQPWFDDMGFSIHDSIWGMLPCF